MNPLLEKYKKVSFLPDYTDDQIYKWINKCGNYNQFVKDTKTCMAGDTWKAAAFLLARDHWGIVDTSDDLFPTRQITDYWGFLMEERLRDLLPHDTDDNTDGLESSSYRYNGIWNFYDIQMCGVDDRVHKYINKVVSYCENNGYDYSMSYWSDLKIVDEGTKTIPVEGKRIWLFPKDTEEPKTTKEVRTLDELKAKFNTALDLLSDQEIIEAFREMGCEITISRDGE